MGRVVRLLPDTCPMGCVLDVIRGVGATQFVEVGRLYHIKRIYKTLDYVMLDISPDPMSFAQSPAVFNSVAPWRGTLPTKKGGGNGPSERRGAFANRRKIHTHQTWGPEIYNRVIRGAVTRIGCKLNCAAGTILYLKGDIYI